MVGRTKVQQQPKDLLPSISQIATQCSMAV
jgi:hypothetical protein